MNKYLELHFPILGQTLPTQHGYPLYSALCKRLPSLHSKESQVRIGPVRGLPVGKGVMQLPEGRSLLKFRVPDDQLRELLPLAGKALEVAGHYVRLGVPHVRTLEPAPALLARLVIVKPNQRAEEKRKPLIPPSPEQFLEVVQRKLAEMGVKGEAGLPVHAEGPRVVQPIRGVLRVHDRNLVGYRVIVQAMSAEESILLQEQGLGGRLRMGCGFFVPTRGGV